MALFGMQGFLFVNEDRIKRDKINKVSIELEKKYRNDTMWLNFYQASGIFKHNKNRLINHIFPECKFVVFMWCFSILTEIIYMHVIY